MIKMMKNTLITAVICLCLIFGVQGISGASQSEKQRIYLQRHIEKVKIQSPQQYQAMLDKAGGVIMNCLSCHTDLKGKKDSH